ncbi:MAG: glycosyltransferase [Bacteroidales bacterium]|nr:glycosyltransferase [Bacteroidales bacterium]
MMLLAIIGMLMMLLALFYALIILGALSGLSIEKRDQLPPKTDKPFVTVIVPVRNEEYRVIQCMESLLQQDYLPDRFEVLISDDFSDDNTLEVVTGFVQNHPQFHCLIVMADSDQQSETGKKRAIARAVDVASGSLILTTDADTLQTPSWISSMVRCYSETGARMILGPVMFSDTPGVFGKMQTLEFLGIMGLTAGFASIGRPIMCNGANLCYEKQAFIELGGFDGNEQFASGDDQFLLWKMKQAFGRHSIHFTDDPDAIVTTLPEKGLRSFFRQRFRWVSKSRGYRDSTVLVVGAVNYLFQAMIPAGFLLGFLSPLYLYLAISLFCFKILVDFPLVYTMSRFFGKRHLLIWYIPAQLFQILYVTISGPMALLVRVRWKGRRV